MKSKTAVPLLVVSMIVALIAGIVLDGWAGGTGDSAVSGGTSAAANTEQLDQDVFVKDKVVDVKITIDPDDFQSMLDNASAEEFKSATVEYNGIQLDNVGVRTKGNLSLRSVVSMPDSDRYSFKLSFDEYISNQTLLGLAKINLNNNYSDATYMREFLTYELAESMGLPTPKYSYVNVYVNGELKGFYLAVEQIGDSYLERNFGNTYGALYKGIMGNGSDLLYKGDSESDYPGLSRKSAKSNDDVLIDMIKELNDGTDYESVLNVEDALGYIALNAVTTNTDSYIGSNKQNYYLYEDDGVFSILPWDYNMAFGGLGSSSTLMIDEPTDGALSERPLVDKLLKVDAYKTRYHEIIDKMLSSYLKDDVFQARVKQLSELISAHVKADPTAFYTYDQYEQGIQQLLSFTSVRVANVAEQLDGTIASAGNGSGNGGGMRGGGMGRGGRNNVAANGQVDAAAAGQGNAEAGQNGQAMQQGGDFGGFGGGMGAPPDGFDRGGGGFPGGGMGGGPGGFGEATAAVNQGSSSEALTTGGLLIVLMLACLFVVYFRRKH
ncbi:CotH kinase family protein [Paenibacillus sp. MMS18-CY102]|uniref:CotH kinase family protein n=1 Tax=Paenibacillus sp. MMS18-CY102 TaxID=2682849 RepID=UPI001366692C|nr:CotH kinase family protein [Paenibacillus sp. MMS18-CY102]MWC29318.1 spore coat protein CotH [Paenibacillus sp. MMS18-CY102]